MELRKIPFTFFSGIYALLERGKPRSQEVLREKILVKSALPQIADSELSGHSMGNSFVVSDYTSLYRIFHDLLAGGSAPFFYHASGSAAWVNTIIGAVQVKQALDEIVFTQAIGDTRATLMGRLDVIKGGSLAGAGVSYAVFRPLAMIEAIKHTPSLLGKVSLGFANAGTIFYALFFVATSAVFGIKLYEDSKFRHQLNRAENLADAVELIQKKATADPEKVYKKLVEKCGSEEAAKKVLIDEAYSNGKVALTLLMKEMGIEKVSDEKLKEIIYKLTESRCNGWTEDQVKQQVEESLRIVGLQMKVEKIGVKKGQKLDRLFNASGKEAVKALRTEKDLAERVRKGDVEAVSKAQKLIDVIKSDSTRKIMVNAFLVAVCLLGIAAMIAAIVFTSGGALVVAAILMLILSGAMLGVDGYFLLESYREERPAIHDKKMLLFSCMIGITVFLLTVALGLTGVMSMGLVPLIVAAVLLALWLGQSGITWAVMERNEKRHKLKHPTLKILLEAIQNREDQERITQMIENLPKELSEELKNLGEDKEQSVLFLIKKVEDIKKERLEQMREALIPLLVN